LTNSEINLSAVCSISERPKRSRSAYGSSRRRETLASATTFAGIALVAVVVGVMTRFFVSH
jgi:ABC-type long-subunit fatty acid transport system fused permease/ATPase subunit